MERTADPHRHNARRVVHNIVRAENPIAARLQAAMDALSIAWTLCGFSNRRAIPISPRMASGNMMVRMERLRRTLGMTVHISLRLPSGESERWRAMPPTPPPLRFLACEFPYSHTVTVSRYSHVTPLSYDTSIM